MTGNFRTQVFCWAYEIMKSTGKCFAVCLAKSWALYRLAKAMQEGTVTFAYEKTDGTLRKAQGTLREVQTKGTGKENFKVMCYYDVEVGGFRSFRIENLVTIYLHHPKKTVGFPAPSSRNTFKKNAYDNKFSPE